MVREYKLVGGYKTKVRGNSAAKQLRSQGYTARLKKVSWMGKRYWGVFTAGKRKK